MEVRDNHEHRGRGEAYPIHYRHETVESLIEQLEAVGAEIARGIDRSALLELLPPGGARNAIDTALWDLEAKRAGKSVWELTDITPRPVTTAFTIGIEPTPEQTGVRAAEAANFPILKIKLDAQQPTERVAAVRAARPDAELTVDANQGWTFAQLVEVAPELSRLGVRLIEQPLPVADDWQLEGYVPPVPLSADESCQHRGHLEQASRRYQVINIKLDKAGGLTEALLLEEQVRLRGLQSLVSNMGGTSLAMAPAFLLAQRCRYVELDGQLLLRYDRPHRLRCDQGIIRSLDPRLWG